MIIRCEYCARQIVSYNEDDQYCVGKEGYAPIRLVQGYVCHICAKDLKEEEEMILEMARGEE